MENWSAGSKIGELFLKWLPRLTAYEKLAENNAKAREVVDSLWKNSMEFRSLLKTLKSGDYVAKRGLISFTGGAIAVQRLTRYVLMLKSLLGYTPKQHPDVQPVKDAIALAEERISKINSLHK